MITLSLQTWGGRQAVCIVLVEPGQGRAQPRHARTSCARHSDVVACILLVVENNVEITISHISLAVAMARYGMAAPRQDDGSPIKARNPRKVLNQSPRSNCQRHKNLKLSNIMKISQVCSVAMHASVEWSLPLLPIHGSLCPMLTSRSLIRISQGATPMHPRASASLAPHIRSACIPRPAFRHSRGH